MKLKGRENTPTKVWGGGLLKPKFQTGLIATVTFVSDFWTMLFIIPIQRNILPHSQDELLSYFMFIS